MNIVGIVAEYNPMHNGHIYNIKKAKELSKADFVIVIMSGSYTEQGNICAINKFDRASLAIENGADMVIELPTVYATSSSENFGKGAIDILNSLGVVTHLAFGSEESDITILQKTAKTYIENEDEIIQSIKEGMKTGVSSSKAYNIVLSKYANKDLTNLFEPNNILAIEYLKALYSLKSNIKPILVHRLNSSHNDSKIGLEDEFASSTSIRNILADGSIDIKEKLDKMKNVIPKNTYDYLLNNSFNTNEKMWNNLKYEILNLGTNGLNQIQGVEEGLEKRLYSKALISNSYNEYIFNVKTKRYTLSRVKRICVNILLNITKEKYEKLSSIKYARVLKVNENKLELLSLISKNSKIPVISKVSDDELKELNSSVKESIYLDIKAHNIANIYDINKDYTNKIKQPKI